MPILLLASSSQLAPTLCLSPASSGVRQHPLLPMQPRPPKPSWPTPNRKANRQQQPWAGWPALGTRGETATSRWQWLLVPGGRSTALELGQGLVSPGKHSASPQGALTRSLVFDEEELQTLLEGVFIHVELDLHPAGRAPRAAHQQGGRSDPEPPGSPVPPVLAG